MKRRIVIKAEVVRMPGREPRDNARYVITNLSAAPQRVYEDIYCQRAEIEFPRPPDNPAAFRRERASRKTRAFHP